MAYSKIQKILFALLCLFVILFPFWCVRGLCSESESVDYTIVNGIGINGTTGVIGNAASDSIAYIYIEPGYLYTVTRKDGYNFKYGFSNEIPHANLQLEDFGRIAKSTFTYSDYQYFYFNFSPASEDSFNVTREPLLGMSGAVDNLSYYAGTNIWESFTNSLPFVLPLVLVCFGMYIIAHFVNKNSKGV